MDKNRVSLMTIQKLYGLTTMPYKRHTEKPGPGTLVGPQRDPRKTGKPVPKTLVGPQWDCTNNLKTGNRDPRKPLQLNLITVSVLQRKVSWNWIACYDNSFCGTWFDMTQNRSNSNIKSHCFFRNVAFWFKIFNKQMKQKSKHNFNKNIKRKFY